MIGGSADKRRRPRGGRQANLISLLVGGAVGAATLWWTHSVIGRPSFVAGIMDFILTAYLCRSFLVLQRRRLLGAILATIILGSAWLAAIARQRFLGGPAEFSDLFSLDDLFLYYGLHGAWYWQAMLALAAAVLLLTIVNFRRPALLECILLAPVFAFLLLFCGKLYAPTFTARLVAPTVSGHSWFPEAAWFGQWDAFLRSAFHYADREAQIADLARRSAPDFGFLDRALNEPDRRNVYFVLLESFYDPAEIAGLKLDADPMAPLFQEWRKQGSPHATSPVFGERSPDAEFELLCGLPATLDSGQVAYAQLTPDHVDCLPRKLAALGWHSESWVPVIPSLFGSDQAYARIGIENRVFRDGMNMSDLDGEALSARSHLQQNLARLGDLITAAGTDGGKPVFNYLFTTAGHFPFSLKKAKRPEKIGIAPHTDMLSGFVNSIYYTSHAVDEYVSSLRKLDPDGIIVILGDHPPPLPMNEAGITYPPDETRKHDVPLIIIDGRRGFAALPPHTPTYHIPFIVGDLLTGGRFCREQDCPIDHPIAVRPLQGAVLAYQPDAAPGVCLTAMDGICTDALKRADSYKLAVYALTGGTGDTLSIPAAATR